MQTVTRTNSSDQSDVGIFGQAAWTRWIAGSSGAQEIRAALADMATRLELSAAQRPLWRLFVEKLLIGFTASAAPDPGDGWDLGKSPALDHMLRLEIAAGRFLGAVEDARESFGRVYASLTPAQRDILDGKLASPEHRIEQAKTGFEE
jgi:hypothetical protein